MTRLRRLVAAGCSVLLLSIVAARAQQGGQVIGGRVVSARDGHPLVRATVSLTDIQAERSVASVTTDGEGRFRFDPVPPGKYRMTGSAANYSSAAYMQHEQYSTAIVTGAGVATGALELRLMPVAIISGRLFDGSEPVKGASVTLYRQTPGSEGKATGQFGVQTDDQGRFEFGHVAEGSYFLVANGTPWYAVHPPVEPPNAQLPYRTAIDPALDVVYPMVFYPDALDPSDALPIEIHGGEQMTANLQMHPVHAVTMTMHLGPGEPANRGFAQLTRTVFGTEVPIGSQMSQMDGVRQYSGLAPGEYNLREMSTAGRMSDARTVDLRGGSTSIDEEAAAETTVVRVTAHSADGETLPSELAVSLRGSGSARTPIAKLDDKGMAEFPAVPAGTYRLVFNGGGHVEHLMSLSMGGKPVSDGKVRVAGTDAVAVEATVSSATLKVDGFVHRDGKAIAGVFVVLVPAGNITGEELFRRDQSDLDGSFTFNGVAPGNYIVFASEDVAALHWTDAATLVAYLLHGVPVAVPARDAEIVHLSGPVNVPGR